MILLNPGPVTLSKRVRNALLSPDLCHREEEFSLLQQDIRDSLLDVYALDPDTWAAVLITGSGTAAIEAMIASLVPYRGKLLVVENGVYGERISKIAAIHGINHLPLPHAWTAEIDIRRLEKLLKENEDITHLAVVHHETTTGRLNELQQIASICRHRNIGLLVDCVSSFGAEQINFEDWNITACAATANKCLHGVPGTSFVIVKREALRQPNKQRTLYLDLTTYCDHQDRGGTPFTQSVQSFYALDEALRELRDEGGWEHRQRDYRQRIGRVRSALKAMGIKPLLPDGCSSAVLHAFYLPTGLGYRELHDLLKQEGYIIYAGQGDLAKSMFRISMMGAITEDEVGRFISVVTRIVS